MIKLLIGLSTVALIAATPAMAQSTTTPASPGTEMNKSQPSTQPSPMPKKDNSATGTSPMGSKSATNPKPAGKIARADSYRASKLIGASVLNARGESIGNINDLIVDREGKIDKVIVGVGGFLGMGERSVALDMGDLSLGSNQNGATVVSTSMTKDQLEALPVWKARDAK